MSLWCYGDPHGDYRPLLRAAPGFGPRDVIVLMGDYDLNAPIKQVLASVIATGAAIRWILGNHESRDASAFDNVATTMPDGQLGHHRCSDGRAVSGLGGVFRSAIWYPRPDPDDPPEHASRDAYVQSLRHQARWRKGMPLLHRTTIFPSDLAPTRERRADVLCTHEAPSSHRHGFSLLDDLAEQIGARWLVHGHHHVSYESLLPNGVRVKGLGIAELWEVPA